MVAFMTCKDAAIDFNPAATTRPNRPNQISVRAMSVKFNSRSISAFDARPLDHSWLYCFLAGYMARCRSASLTKKVRCEKVRAAATLLKSCAAVKQWTFF